MLRKYCGSTSQKPSWKECGECCMEKNWSMTESLVLYCLFIYLSVYCLLVRSFVCSFVRSLIN